MIVLQDRAVAEPVTGRLLTAKDQVWPHCEYKGGAGTGFFSECFRCSPVNEMPPMLYTSVSQNVLLAGPFWLRKITTDRHIIAHVNIVCPDDRYPKLKIYMTDFGQILIHCSSIHNNPLHCISKMSVARFVGTGSFLKRYSNSHVKYKVK